MGTDELAGQLGSRVLFVPWGAESVTCAAELALVPDELAAWPPRTLRSRTPVDGADVVAIIRPSYDLLADVRLPANGFAIVAEDPSDPLRGWAQFVGARDMSTGDVLSLDVDDATQDALNELVDSGYKGWTDDRSHTRARAAAGLLRSHGLTTSQIFGHILSGRYARLDSSGAYQFEFCWDDEPRWPLVIDIDGQLVDSLPVENSELQEDMVMHLRPAATTPPWLVERLGASPLHFSDRWDACSPRSCRRRGQLLHTGRT